MVIQRVLSLLMLVAVAAGCSESAPLTLPQPTQVSFRDVLYFATEAPDAATVAETGPLKQGRVRLVDAVSADISEPGLSVTIVGNVAEDYPLPDADSLRYFARGLSDAEQARVHERNRATILHFSHPSGSAYRALRVADEVAHELARAHDGLVWDEELRLLYSVAAWEQHRLLSPAEVPSILSQTVVHAYSNGEYLRAVSLGMSKLALPDLVVERTARANSSQMVSMLNGVAQYLIEGGRIDADGSMLLDAASLKVAAVRDELQRDWFDNATGRARIRLEPVPPEEGDADNALFALRFDGYEGPDEFARQDRAVSEFFGWSDSIKMLEHDDEVTAASAAARALLPEIRERFQRGLGLKEQLIVKAPFATPDGGAEWMWVEVTEWKDERIQGLLVNEPFDVPDLHSGQVTVVSMEDVFDYQWNKADGSHEGNTTGKIIEAMQGESRGRGASGSE